MKKKVGDKRTFSFNDFAYEIKEIIDDPNMCLDWDWDSGACPHCKKKIIRHVKHEFYKIEILIPEHKEKIEDCSREEVIIMGDTLDNRKMKIPIQQYDDVFDKTKLFKKLRSNQ